MIERNSHKVSFPETCVQINHKNIYISKIIKSK